MRPLSAIERALVRTGGRLASSAGRGGRGLLVLIYHRVLAQPDPLSQGDVEADCFASQMQLLATCFNPLPLSEALERLQSRSLPPRAVSVTFDDGYADNLEVAVPIMRRSGVRGTVFVATGYLDGGIMFNDAVIEAMRQAPARLDLSDLGFGVLELADLDSRRRSIERLIGELKYREPEERRALALEMLERAGGTRPRGLMLSRAQVRLLRDAGVDVGAHTDSHPILTRIAPTDARDDMAKCRQELEAILGEPPRLFAYPNGRPGRDYDQRHVAMARDLGFTAAVSTAWGAAFPGCDLFQVPRVAPWDATAGRYAARLVKSYAQRNYTTAES